MIKIFISLKYILNKTFYWERNSFKELQKSKKVLYKLGLELNIASSNSSSCLNCSTIYCKDPRKRVYIDVVGSTTEEERVEEK
jgi:hypothetical protein